ncbi:MAG: hypothetical protein IPG64_23430 [Haliea sp.]|nr:hypothetical protein [Haliea sp.]
MERELEYFREIADRCVQLEQEGWQKKSDEELNVDSCKKAAEHLLALEERVAEHADCKPFSFRTTIEVIQPSSEVKVMLDFVTNAPFRNR